MSEDVKKTENKEVKKIKIEITPMIAGLLAVVLIVGLLVGTGIGFMIKPNQEVQIPQDQNKGLSEEALKEKVVKYLNDNFLEAQGVTGSVNKMEKFSDNLYSITLDLKKDGNVLQQASLYVTLDGEEVIIGNILKTSEPLPKANETADQADAKPQELPKTDKPNVKLFVMSYCPYGQEAETGLKPLLATLKDSVDFETHFVIYDNYCGYGILCKATDEQKTQGYTEDASQKAKYCLDADQNIPQYCSMHGVNEVNEDARQMVILKYFKDKWWDYVTYVNANTTTADIEVKWKEAAASVGLDANKIQEYYNNEALDLLNTEIALSEKYGAQGSPTLIINDTDYALQNLSTATFQAAVCSAFNTQPATCSQEVTAGTTGTATTTGGCGAS